MNFGLIFSSKWITEFIDKVFPQLPKNKTAYVEFRRSSGAQGGSFNSGAWRTRSLNTVNGDSGIVSLASNQFTLPAGKYKIQASGQCYRVNQNKLRIYNVTDAQTATDISGDDMVGFSCYMINATAGGAGDAELAGTIEIAGTKTFELQHRCTTSRGTNGFGIASGYGFDEVYAQVIITRL